MKRAFCYTFIVLLIGSVAAMPVSAGTEDLQELQATLAKADNLKRSLSVTTAKISPDVGKFRADYEQALDRIGFLKTRIIDEIEKATEGGDLVALDAYIAFVQALPSDSPTRNQLLPLSSALRSKLLFGLVSNKDLAKNRAAVESRMAFLARHLGTVATAPDRSAAAEKRRGTGVPIYVAFHWHMHQPIYWPDEDVVTTENRHVYSYSVLDVFFSRTGPYTSWPFDAVKMLADAAVANGGAQVSFSGSLIENLERIAAAKMGFNNWADCYRAGRRLKTARGNPRLDLVSFGYHHPLMALIGYEDIRRQIAMHRDIVKRVFGADVPYSKGIFPPENAFAEWMIPALVDEDLDWVMVDNIHFNRAAKGYPWVKGENLYPPNPADQRNVQPGEWVQLNGLWAPSKVSAWACKPHYVELIDPATGKTAVTPAGKKARMIAVPTERYLGNEDGRGGFGALNYEMVMAQLLPHNTDPQHPVLLVLHHDGDNYGGGTDSYYHANFARFVEWVKANPDRFVCTTVQDYLDMFPPATDDVIHVEPGSWAGADNGDPEFLKWNGDPNPTTGYSPDRNSWGVMTAARNIVATARDQGVPAGALAVADRKLSVAQTSCYEYWDGTEMWDSHPTRACNLAVDPLLPLLDRKAADKTPPALYQPQRQPYNPGGMEWGQTAEPSDFTVWTYAYDVSGLASVVLEMRVHPGQQHADAACQVLAGGEWQTLPMQAKTIAAQTNPKPTVKAPEYAAEIKGIKDALVDYYVEATDMAGNVTRSPLLHVYVGNGNGSGTGGPGNLTWAPAQPKPGDAITFTSDRPAKLHWGINGWTLPPTALWPEGTVIWPDRKAVETPLVKSGAAYVATIRTTATSEPVLKKIDVVLHYDDNTWGKDASITLQP